MAARRGKRSSPPSRRRYEKSHPVASFRSDRQLHHELKTAKEEHGLSVADVVKLGLGKVQASQEAGYRKGFEEGSRQGSQEGYDDGFEVAREHFEVPFPCAGCGEPHVSITTDAAKRVAADMMYRAGWGDLKCSSRQQ